MKIYISGISGTGMGPLALMAKAAGFEVYGSDLLEGAIYNELVKNGIEVKIGPQDGEFLKQKLAEGVDWFVYTSALPANHPELLLARAAGIKVTKRDALTAFLVKELGLKMVAVAGTHGKTTTTSMIVYVALRLGLPVSYIVGTTLGFAPSGAYHPGDEFFVYEADEYDRNFLNFEPWLSVITTVSYDHPDIYKTREEYEAAFLQFERQSENVLKTDGGAPNTKDFTLAGEARRQDAAYAMGAVMAMCREMANEGKVSVSDLEQVIRVLNDFPGVGRRFERLAKGVYSDYAHHPEEIRATMDVALDECRLKGYKGVVVVYQPHQNTRQHEVFGDYKDAFIGATKVYWLPTYLTREDDSLVVITPAEFVANLSNAEMAETAELDDALFAELMRWRDEGYLVLLLTAGPADGWLRGKLAK